MGFRSGRLWGLPQNSCLGMRCHPTGNRRSSHSLTMFAREHLHLPARSVLRTWHKRCVWLEVISFVLDLFDFVTRSGFTPLYGAKLTILRGAGGFYLRQITKDILWKPGKAWRGAFI